MKFPVEWRTTALIAFFLGVCLISARAGDAAESPTDGQPSLAGPGELQPIKDREEPAPAELEGIDVTEHLGDRLPLDAEFVDETGRKVRLRDYFSGHRPVILTLNYYSCPMLCTLQLNGMTAGLKELDWNPGADFEIVTISINPLETPVLAREKKQNYIAEYGRAEAAKGWHFLTGRKSNIDAVARAVGFGFRYDAKTGQYAHPAVATLVSPDGRIMRYLYGIEFNPKTLRLALVEAGEGKVGSTMDKLILTCFHYDPESGSYALQAVALMRAGGAMTVLILGMALLGFWLREARRRRERPRQQESHT